MARRTQPDSYKLLGDLRQLLDNFESELSNDDLRSKVIGLIPSFKALRRLGKSLMPVSDSDSGMDRVLRYFLKYPLTVIKGDELMVVSGIGDWPRRVRQLRVEFGWKIATGVTMKEMATSGDLEPELNGQNLSTMKVQDYILLSPEQDREAALRWHEANSIRKTNLSVRDKILKYLQANVGQSVSGEELRYVADNKTEWARRVRELRTEYGWPVHTRQTGRPDLMIGEYVLEADRQSPPHDRHIPDSMRGVVLRRDEFKCTNCGWNREQWTPDDPRILELHHVQAHAAGGENSPENLTTLCNVCHDDIPRNRE